MLALNFSKLTFTPTTAVQKCAHVFSLQRQQPNSDLFDQITTSNHTGLMANVNQRHKPLEMSGLFKQSKRQIADRARKHSPKGVRVHPR